jgi:hypothetical protein
VFKSFNLHELRRVPRFSYYFRYPLSHSEFREVRGSNGRLLGRYAAKPLYGRLTREGKVDRSAPFNGQVAVMFIPARARSGRAGRLILARMPRDEGARPDGRRNWPAIRAAAERAVRRSLDSAAA